MRWDCINLKSGTWVIPANESKNGVPLNVVLGPEVVALLSESKDENTSEWVFPGRGATGHLADPKKAWKRLLNTDQLAQVTLRVTAAGYTFKREAGESLEAVLSRGLAEATAYGLDTSGTRLADFRPHDLRHTLGSYQAIAGASLLIIGKSLGHKSLAATQRYAHLDMDPIRESVNLATKTILKGDKKLTGQVKPS